MVDPWVLASDVLQNVVFLATPPLLWLLLYLLAWEWPALARATGFDRVTFFLLLPGVVLGSIANLPFLGYAGAILAINIGGGLVPLLLSVLLLRRGLPASDRGLIALGVAFAVETAATLLWVIALPTAVPLLAAIPPLTGQLLGLAVIAFAVPAAYAVLAPRGPALRPTLLVLVLASLALVITFATTETAPSIGIISSFPGYLIAPALVGALAVLLARRMTGAVAYRGFAIGYASTTFGVLVGADVLRQPPLYANPTNLLLSIGGAGESDLLYLTGLLSLAVAFLVYAGLLRAKQAAPPPPAPSPEEQARTPVGRLRRALFLLLAGRFALATQEAARASAEARGQTRALFGLPAVPFTDRPWAELGAPPWVDADQTNLDALAAAPDLGGRDAWRAHLTARNLVRIAQQIGRRRYGSTARRSVAFVLDLLLLIVPAVGIWWYLSATLSGTVGEVLAGALFNAAAYGFAAYAFLYFVVAEVLWGTTVGKLLLRLRVRDRRLRPPRPIPVLVRDLPKLLPLTIVGFGGAVATLLAVRGGEVSPTAGGVALPASLFVVTFLVGFIALGVGLCGLASVLAIHGSGESQRLGDYLGGTWVIQE